MSHERGSVDPGSDDGAAERLKSYIRLRAALEDSRADINAQLREMNSNMHKDGFSVPTLHLLMKRYRLSPDEVMTADALLETYELAAGTGAAAGGTLEMKRGADGVFVAKIVTSADAGPKLSKATKARRAAMAMADLARRAREIG